MASQFLKIAEVFAITLTLCSILAGCGGGASDPQQQFRAFSQVSAPQITKGALFGNIMGESTPVVFNGEVLYVTSAVGLRAKIYRQTDKTLLADIPSGMEFQSAIVNNGTLYIFGSKAGRSQLGMISTTDLVNWTTNQTVYTAPAGITVYNSSVASDPTGFVMAYEICETAEICFNARFQHSTDLISWAPIGGQYERNYYTACPTIRYVGGYYYMFFLSDQLNGNTLVFSTTISRSVDLVNWQFSPITVLSPNDDVASNNASDMDLVEFNGRVMMIYENGSQIGLPVANSGLREASYNGTLAQFVALFFK
ncbi:hypothetical protein [Sideroxydans lithotrophicus]|uniref:Uncharacterized protein n=1 Tax=Sideroxydans lithotrophicus (strain ES-1) TaxID=580332 RepID=D5CT30_SIDLE|nr:hypothetical protein [Sideroxydans lithotrophicus]ADE12116.1 hypothetical protein Slit_1887 [Sideroxydans lithotrophicus ES-1]